MKQQRMNIMMRDPLNNTPTIHAIWSQHSSDNENRENILLYFFFFFFLFVIFFSFSLKCTMIIVYFVISWSRIKSFAHKSIGKTKNTNKIKKTYTHRNKMMEIRQVPKNQQRMQRISKRMRMKAIGVGFEIKHENWEISLFVYGNSYSVIVA